MNSETETLLHLLSIATSLWSVALTLYVVYADRRERKLSMAEITVAFGIMVADLGRRMRGGDEGTRSTSQRSSLET